MIVETVAWDLLLIALDVPDGLRVLVLVLDLYGIVFALALGAACVTRPHVVTPTNCASATARTSTCAFLAS